MKKFFKRPLVIILMLAVIFAAGAIYFYYGKSQAAPYQTSTVQRGDISQIVSVTGTVKPSESVDLAFERSGRVISIAVNVGGQVVAGQILATLDNSDLSAQIDQAKAGVAAQQAQLDALKIGARPEELQIAQTNVANAQKTQNDAKTNLENVKNSADASLRQIYDGAINAAAKSVVVATESIYVLTDIQSAHFLGSDQNSISLAQAKSNAVAALLGGINAGYWTNNYISQLDGGAKALVETAQINPTDSNIDSTLSSLANALDLVKNSLDVIPVTSDLTASERTNLNAEKTNIDTEIITISGKQQSIKVQLATNTYNIKTAETAVNSAQSNLSAAQDQLILKQAGSTPEQIAAQEAQVKSALANVEVLQAQLAKTIMRSPISGIITKQDTRIGEIVSPNVPVISIISVSQFQIEANVSEADIAKIKVGQDALITLDAYGSNVIFNAKTIKIDPAETAIEGVATYKVTLQFSNENEQIKSGLTANIDILTDKRTNILIIPQRAVIQNNNEQYVLLAMPNNKTAQQKIVTGLKGSDGNIEVISGLNENEKIVSYGGVIK